MKRLITVLFLLNFITLLAFRIPGKTKITPELRDFFTELQQHYAEGNLYETMQARKERLMSIRDPRARMTAMKNDVLSIKVPVVCGLFADNTPVFPDFQAAMQSKLFTGSDSTMTNYYREVSYNQFELTGTVFDWVHLSKPESIYVNDDIGYHGDMGRLIHEILDSLDKTVDFSQFDNDGDGVVENLCVVHSNTGQEYYGKDEGVKIRHIWSHSYYLKYYPQGVYRTNDTNSMGKLVSIDKYTVQPEVDYANRMEGIGVYCHEFGHVLGLPDLYDIDYSTNGVGEWCLMSSGNDNTGHCPAHLCAWSKEFMGWISAIPITEDMDNLVLPPIETNPVAYKVWRNGQIESFRPVDLRGKSLSDMGKEYFMVEYRKKISFDIHLNGSGLLISHVYNPNNNGSNQVNTTDIRPGVKIMQADGRDDLKSRANEGDAGDVFPGSFTNRSFNESTQPNSNDYDGNYSMVSIYNISDPDSVITMSVAVSFTAPELQYVKSIPVTDKKRYFAGDTVSLTVKLYNRRGAADNIDLQFSSPDPDIGFQANKVSLTNIPAMDTIMSAIPLVFKISSLATDKRTFIQITASNTKGYYQIINFPFHIGFPPRLLIKDNRYVGNVNPMLNALDSLSENFEYLDLAANSDSTGFYLNEFAGLSRRKTIFWLCGNFLGSFSSNDLRDSLRYFLSKGGNLLISGGKVPIFLSRKDSLLMRDYFHVAYDTLTTRTIVRGLPFDPISSLPDGSGMILRLDTIIQNSTLLPLAGAYPLFTYWGSNQKYAGVRYDSGISKMVFLSFPLERVVKEYENDANFAMIYQKINGWFDGTVSIEEDGSKPSVNVNGLQVSHYPNPFNAQFNLEIETEQAGKIELNVYDILGRPIFHERFMMMTGRNHVTISADQWTSGLYFYNVKQGQLNQNGKMVLLK